MGYRAMRMRFLDLEPEEVFDLAKKGDGRCAEFVDLWHRALAAATASFIHLAGPGRFYFTGHNVGFLDLPVLRESPGNHGEDEPAAELFSGSPAAGR